MNLDLSLQTTKTSNEQRMTNSQKTHLAQHLHQVHFGGNWTASNVENTLRDLDCTESQLELPPLNSIAKLTYHMWYFVHAILEVFRGNKLDAHDKFSFDVPEFKSDKEWRGFVKNYLDEVSELVDLIGSMPEDLVFQDFELEKYGSYYRNLHGLIEHTHYHLGQISLIKKLIRTDIIK